MGGFIFCVCCDLTVAAALAGNLPSGELGAPSVRERDAHGFTIHSIDKRLDKRSDEDLRKELFDAREVALDAPLGDALSNVLVSRAKTLKANGQDYLGSVLVVGEREDLAGLPFRFGKDTAIAREKAESLDAFSQHLRRELSLPKGRAVNGTDSTVNTEELYKNLTARREVRVKGRLEKQWACAEAVPCIRQMLQDERSDVRRMGCELLRGIDTPQSTEALVHWAVFDTDAGNRAAAIDALGKRERKAVSQLLSGFIRYPWPRAVEHAAEALVALNCQEAVPFLAVAYSQPDPDAPFQFELPGEDKGTFRQQVVRINHHRNCVLCHAPSLDPKDLVRGAMPDPKQALPPLNSRVYYEGTRRVVVRADITYLKQDFTVFQRVDNPGHWPSSQRFDYFVAIVRENSDPDSNSALETAKPDTRISPYQLAIRFAIVELTQRNPDRNTEWLADQREAAGIVLDTRKGEVARYLSLMNNPLILLSLQAQESVKPMLALTGTEVEQLIRDMQSTFRVRYARLALIAHLTPLATAGEPANRAKAATLLTVLTSNTRNDDLAKAMKKAAEEMAVEAKK